MPDICSDSVSPNNCGHRTITIGGVSIEMHESEITPLSDEEKEQLYKLAIRHKGVSLAQLSQRVVFGDEATNMKTYDLVSPGVAISKTNVGTAWTNVLPGTNGQRALVDFTGCTKVLIVANVNFVGTGPFGLRVVRDSDDSVLYENDAIAQTGERELNTGWLDIPQALIAQDKVLVRLQIKSAVASDDPVVRRVQLLME